MKPILPLLLTSSTTTRLFAIVSIEEAISLKALTQRWAPRRWPSRAGGGATGAGAGATGRRTPRRWLCRASSGSGSGARVVVVVVVPQDVPAAPAPAAGVLLLGGGRRLCERAGRPPHAIHEHHVARSVEADGNVQGAVTIHVVRGNRGDVRCPRPVRRIDLQWHARAKAGLVGVRHVQAQANAFLARRDEKVREKVAIDVRQFHGSGACESARSGTPFLLGTSHLKGFAQRVAILLLANKHEWRLILKRHDHVIDQTRGPQNVTGRRFAWLCSPVSGWDPVGDGVALDLVFFPTDLVRHDIVAEHTADRRFVEVRLQHKDVMRARSPVIHHRQRGDRRGSI